MAFLQYDISVVGVDKVRQAMRAVEAEAAGLGRQQVLRDPLGRSPLRGKLPRGANDNADLRAAEALYRKQDKLRDRLRQAKDHSDVKSAESQFRRNRKFQEKLRSANDNSDVKSAEAHFRRSARLQDRLRGANDNGSARAAEAIHRNQEALRAAALRREERDRLNLARRVAAEEKRSAIQFANTTKGVIGATASKAAAIGRGAIAMAGLGGGALFASAVHGVASTHAKAADLANQLVERDASPQKLASTKREVMAYARATRGFATDEVLAALSDFQATAGESEATKRMAPVLSEMALASGTSPETIGMMDSAIYAGLRRATGGAEKSVTELITTVEKMNRVFAAMGQRGAIELKDLAVHGGEIAMVSRQFAGDPVESLKQVGAWIQVARQGGVVSAAEAATAIENLPNDMKTHAADIDTLTKSKGLGSIFTDKTRQQFKPIQDVIPMLIAASEGDLVKMGEITGIRGGRALQGYVPHFNEAYNAEMAKSGDKKKAREAGMKAVHQEHARFGDLEMSKDELKNKADFRMKEPDKQFQEEMKKLTAVIGENLLPQLTLLIPSIAKLIPPLGTLAEVFATAIKYIADAPVEAAFMGLGTLFAIEIAKARIGAVISSALMRLLLSGRATAGAASAVAAGASTVAQTAAAVGTTAVMAGAAGAGGAAGAPGGAGGPGAPGAGAPGAVVARGGFMAKPTGAAMLGAAGLGTAIGVGVYDTIAVEGRRNFDKTSEGTQGVIESLKDVHGKDLRNALVDARAKKKAIEDESGLFGTFMNFFGAGPEAELNGLADFIGRKQAELDYFNKTGQIDPGTRANMAEMERRKGPGSNDDGGKNVAADLNIAGKMFGDVVERFSQAVDKMPKGSAPPGNSLNTGSQPTQPVVK